MDKKLLIARSCARITADLDAIINDEAEHLLRDADGIVIRVSQSVWDAIHASSEGVTAAPNQIKEIRKRMPLKDIYFLRDGGELCRTASAEISATEGQGAVSNRASETFADQFGIYSIPTISSMQPLVAQKITAAISVQIAAADLRDLIDENLRMIRISGGKNFHFVLPSGCHSNYFVRLAETFRNADQLGRAAFWVAKSIVENFSQKNAPAPTSGLLIVDNPSMLAIAIMATSMTKIPNIKIECLEQYPQTVFETIQLVDRLASNISPVDHALMIVGISSSGRLLTSIRNTLAKRDAVSNSKLHTMTLYSYRDAAPDALCKLDFSDYFIADSAETCTACTEGLSRPVSIHPSVYYVSEPTEIETPLPASLFAMQRDFIERFGNADGVLRVHVDDPNDRKPRHHSFYIDIASLLKTKEIWTTLQARLTALSPKPTLIFAPDHGPASMLVDFASKALGIPKYQHSSFEGLNTTPELVTKLISKMGDKKISLLVIDDVVRTGSRFGNFNRSIRDEPAWAQLASRLEYIHFFAILSTTESKKNWLALQRGLCTRHTWGADLNAIYSIPLPNWSVEDCPWCQERRLLRFFTQAEAFERNLITDRLSVLENTADGVMATPFLNPPNTIDPNATRGSEIFPSQCNAMQTLFMFASAVQQSRNGDDGIDEMAYPHPRLVANRVFNNNFNERMKWKALFRALKATELHDEAKKQLAKLISSDVISNSDAHYHGEALLACVRGFCRGVDLASVSRMAEKLKLNVVLAQELIEKRVGL